MTTEIAKDAIVVAAHHEAIHVEAKAPTATADGHIEYWYCGRCGTYFADEALTRTIRQEETILAATGEETPSTPDDGPRPVSYTHLDVYKRQTIMWALTQLLPVRKTGPLIWTAIHTPIREVTPP